MNILYVMNYAGVGGSEKYVETLAARKRPGVRVHFIYNLHGGLCARMEEQGVNPVRVNMRSPFDLAAARQIARYCEEHRVDVIHAQFQRENYVSILSKLFYPRARVVYTSHIIMRNGPARRLLNRVVCRGDDAVIAVCNAGARQLAVGGVPAEKIRVVFNGVPVHARRLDLGTGREPFTFITVTRFSEEKGVFFLLEAVTALKGMTDKPFRVTMVGGGPLFQNAIAFAKTNGLAETVTFTGFRQDAGALLAEAGAYVNSSANESLSFAILEALAAGLPVIATDVGGNPDIVNEETRCGLLVAYGDAPGLARAMLRVMSAPEEARAWGENARRTAETIFNEDAMVEQTYKIYEEARGRSHDY